MSKIMQVSTYDAENEVWNTPVDIGAKAENVEIQLSNSSISDVQTEVSITIDKLSRIASGSKLDSAIIDTITPTGSDSSTVITGNGDVDVDSGVTIKNFAEKYNRRGVRINNAISNINAVSRITISADNWSSVQAIIDDEEYYTYSTTATKISNPHPEVMLGTTLSRHFPSLAEKQAYMSVDYITVDTDTNAIRCYAKNKPTVDFVLIMKGVTA